jgi:para-aminobenzoate synthetase component 1
MLQYFPYPLLKKNEIVNKINELASENISFLFVIDFKGEEGYVISSPELDEHFVKFDFWENNLELKPILKPSDNFENKKELFRWDISPVSFDTYFQKFHFVQSQIRIGNSYLVNLTQPTKIHSNLSLLDLYEKSRARYKLWFKDKFTVLSPETFIQIKNGKIAAFPMKGTIDASLPQAEDIILNDPKEKLNMLQLSI